MVDVLIRGIPDETLQGIREYAKRHNLSLNQALIQLIETHVNRLEPQERAAKLRTKAEQRLREIRARIQRKYDLDEPQ